jgi:hypothetical protein
MSTYSGELKKDFISCERYAQYHNLIPSMYNTIYKSSVLSRNLSRKSSKSSSQPLNNCGASFDPRTGIAASPVCTTMCGVGGCAIVMNCSNGISVGAGFNVFG